METLGKITAKKLAIPVAMALFSLSLATTQGSAFARNAEQPPELCPGLPADQPIYALSTNNKLFTYDPRQGMFTNPVKVKGVEGNLLGIDFRVSRGLLYGLTDTDKIYIIKPRSGETELVSTLSTSFDAGYQAMADFNPVPDALRLIGSNGQNFAVNDVEGGTVTVQTSLSYAKGDVNEGQTPYITAGAYINNVAGAAQTTLYNIDYDKDVLTTQTPPASGVNRTVGPLGINFAPVGGLEVFTNAQGINAAVAVSVITLYCVNLDTGAATPVAPLYKHRLPLPKIITSDGFIDVAISTVGWDK